MNKIILIAVCHIWCISAVYCQNWTDTIQLNEVSVTIDRATVLKKTQPLDVVSQGREYLTINRGSSLMSSLDKLPGVSAMQVGQGFSKPMIRGLGFNRVAVFQNGIKQQGQQWGGDHGLEIDQYDVESLDVLKGAASLQYGSDAIAGAIIVNPMKLKKEDGLSGNVLLNGTSNNRQLGGSMDINYQNQGKNMQVRATHQNYEDYRVPTNHFRYMGSIYPIHNKVLKNTAGRETDLSLQGGVVKDAYSSNILVSNVYAKTGFFAGAHGIPSEVDLADDGKYRNIELPYQRVNHFKVAVNQYFRLDNRHDLNLDLGYQNNNRKEFAEPHSHSHEHGEEEEEHDHELDSDLELELKLQTISLNLSWLNKTSGNNRLTIGLNTEYQNNGIDGFAFLLPRFEQVIGGMYAIDRYRLSDKLVLTAGLRYDYGRLWIDEYIDSDQEEEHQQLSPNLNKAMDDFSFSLGVDYRMTSEWNMKFNIGKSFRMPTANELSSNGVHHGTFRHELGNQNLLAEKSYQADYLLAYTKTVGGFIDDITLSTGLFVNYFPNFIFLNPLGDFTALPDAIQSYRYEQSKAFRTGGEFLFGTTFGRIFRWETTAEYVYGKNLDSKSPIPFTPPFNLLNELSANWSRLALFRKNRIAVSHQYTATQNRVIINELKTSSYNLWDASLATTAKVAGQDVSFTLQVQNILDKKYYNHLSFYRYMDLPEMGRNFRLTIQVPINTH